VVTSAAVVIAAGIITAAVESSGSRLPSGVATGAAVGTEREAQLINGAETASARGDSLTAIEDYEKVIRTDPNQVVALTNEGWILVQTQEPQLLSQGLGLLARAERDNPDYPPAHVYRGVAYLSEDDYADAVPELQWYLAHQPDPTLAPRVRAALATARAGLARQATASTARTSPPGAG
jgi:tetratricopeptide (TPR) repeat protein